MGVPESKWPMLSVEEARALVMGLVTPLAAADLTLADLLGRVLAEDIVATQDMPPFAASTVDGFALVVADMNPRRRLIGEQTAGQMHNLTVTPGTVARITTGAPVPQGADAVVMVEHTEERDGHVIVHEMDLRPGANIRPIGQDIATGDLVLKQGLVLGPAEIGVVATLGRATARVIPPPTVGVLSTGDELVEPGAPPGRGQIRDSNRYALMAAVRQAGGVPLNLGIARDEPGDLERRVRQGLTEADVLVTSGGVSMGHLDLVKPLLERLGTIHFGRLRMKPGKPLTFATVGDKPVFALPGNPVSSLVSFDLFVRPVLRRLQGYVDVDRPMWRVRLLHDVRHDPDRAEYQRAFARREGGEWVAATTGFQGSSRLMSMVGANALIVLPVGVGNVSAGEIVDAVLLDAANGY
ncbi:MAG: molybdopterin molybdotransferase MoeA [Anaerolineae bacterium]|nr:molybdopterin molybdotransferase MoeA [Anaerolineae bacterium]